MGNPDVPEHIQQLQDKFDDAARERDAAETAWDRSDLDGSYTRLQLAQCKVDELYRQMNNAWQEYYAERSRARGSATRAAEASRGGAG